MTWNGATLYKSADGGSTYDAVLSMAKAASIGTSAGALGDFTSGNIFDELNTVSVVMSSGSLVSYSELQALNGAGLCVLGAAGRWEVLQYKTATLTGVNTYKLSGLLRGRRGTEWAQGLHQAGDTFVLASLTAWSRTNPGTAEIGLERMYKGVTSKTSIAAANAQSFANTAVGLECYAPVQIGGGRNAANDVTINWIPRTRIGGEWRDYVDVPLGESAEAYQVEIWSGGYTTLLRTITGISSPTTIYSAADQTADGITPGDPVHVSIYQLSAVVGRGYEARGTI
jgi:hypothetical protein